MFVAGAYIGGSIGYIILVHAEPAQGFANRDTVLLVGSLAFAVFFGLLSLFLWRLGLALIGALGGFTFALFLLSWKGNGIIEGSTGRWIFIAVFAVVGAIIILFAEKHVIIFSTSISGSVSTLCGIDCFVQKGFITAVQVFLSSSSNSFTGVFVAGPETYGYLAGVIVLAIVGILVQYHINSGRSHRPMYNK